MKIIELVQGSDSWHAHRATARNASDAPALFGASPYVTRSDLVKRRATGIHPEHDQATQARFDRGHAVEPALRAYAEKVIGEDLYPIVGTTDDGYLSASFDGVTLMEEIIGEAKQTNAAKMEAMRAGLLPEVDRWQIVQQFAVCETAQRCIYCVGDGTDEGTVHLILHRSDFKADIDALRPAWAQLDDEVANYQAPEAVEKVVAEPVESLPAPVVTVTGELALQDNFKVFEARLRHFLEHRLIREPKTDQDFVDLDAQIKAMKQGREALKGAKAQMLAQVQPIDQASKTADMLDSLLQQNVKMAENLLTAEKDRRKGEIVAGGVKAFADHIAALNVRLGKPYMPSVPVDFGGCVRGLKSLASMEDKVNTELARAKIAANEVADRIDANLKHLQEKASAHKFLFADAATIVLKAPDDLQTLVSSRIAEHDRAEAARLEAEREKIRKEEADRLQREADARARAEAEAASKKAADEAEAARKAQEVITVAATAAPVLSEKSVADQNAREFVARVEAKGAANMAAQRALEDEKPTLKLGEINARLGYTVSAEFLAELGYVAHTERSSNLYRESLFPAICDAIRAHTTGVREQYAYRAAA